MTTDRLARVRALLAKAESTSHPEEADAYFAKAAAIMAKYGINEALLHAAGQRNETPEQRDIVMDNPYPMQKAYLLLAVAEPLRCRTVARRHRDTKLVYKSTVVGFTSDIDRVVLLYTSLLMQAIARVSQEWPVGNVSTVTHRKSWFVGYATRIRERLVEAESNAAREMPRSDTGVSTELVLRDRKAIVTEEYDRLFGDRLLASSSMTVQKSSYAAGTAAANRADIGQTPLGQSRKALGQ